MEAIVISSTKERLSQAVLAFLMIFRVNNVAIEITSMDKEKCARRPVINECLLVSVVCHRPFVFPLVLITK